MLLRITFFVIVLCKCSNVRSATPYDPAEYRQPTRGMKDLMLKVDSSIIDIVIVPGSSERAVYLMKFLMGYNGLLDRALQMVKERKVKGYEIYKALRDIGGPMFIRLKMKVLMEQMLSAFKWTGEATNKFNELLEKTKFKWHRLKTLGKQMIDELPS